MSFYEKHKKGIIGTAIFHIAILLMLILLGFFTPLPLPGEEGILVNFGTSDQGLGDLEPAPRRREPEPSPPVTREEETAPPTSQPVTSPPVSQPEPAEEVAMTQDYEETAAIDAAEKKRKEAEKQRIIEEERRRQKELEEKRRIELEEQKRQEEIEKQRLAELKRKRQAEIERKRQAEIERKRQAEEERKKREEEQRKISEINSRAKGAFGGNTDGSGGQGTSNSTSQGVTFPGGNQGVPTGDPNASRYGPGGSGSGNQGSGVSYSLKGRTAKSLPKPHYPGNDEGIVVVKVTVDKYGKVTAAEPGTRGTTIMDKSFWNEAKQAAIKAKFNLDENAPAFQQGTISYRFSLD